MPSAKNDSNSINNRLYITCLVFTLLFALSMTMMSVKNMILIRELEQLKTKTCNLTDELAVDKKIIGIILKEYRKKHSFFVKVTAYHPDSGGINSNSNSSMTATMTPHKAGRTCAISTELVEDGWLGKEIYVRGYGMLIANDRLSTKINGKQIDICVGSYKEAMNIGENYNVLATLVSRQYINLKIKEEL